MVRSKRIVALVLMALMSTVIPATYQKAVQPRVQAMDCDIYIQDLLFDEEATEPGKVVFTAYLKIENTAGVEVVLSRLNLDMYFKPNDRHYWIGTFNTTSEYVIPAKGISPVSGLEKNGIIGSYLVNNQPFSYVVDPTNEEAGEIQDVSDFIKGDANHVIAKISFIEDVEQGSATSEAFQELIDGSLNIVLRGKAKMGPFEFEYQKSQTLDQTLWDSNFVIVDVFNYFSSDQFDEYPVYDPTSINSDSSVYVVRAKMRNPSNIPMVLKDYSFNLMKDDETVAYGLNLSSYSEGIGEALSKIAFDPDYISGIGSRRNLLDLYMDGKYQIELPAGGNEWVDILFLFNFTDPSSLNPDLQDSKTKDNLNWFMNQIFMNPTIGNLKLNGSFNLLIGSGDNNGININIGKSSNRKIINDVKFHQFPAAKILNTEVIDTIDNQRIPQKLENYDEQDYNDYIDWYNSPYLNVEPSEAKKARALIDYLTVGSMNVSNIDINRTTSGYIESSGVVSYLNENTINSSTEFPADSLSSYFIRFTSGNALGKDYRIADFIDAASGDNSYLLEENLLLKDGAKIGDSFDIVYIPMDIRYDIDASITFENPYRLAFNFTSLATDYYRTGDDNNNYLYDEEENYFFGNGLEGSVLTINRAVATNATNTGATLDDIRIIAQTTYIPHEISLTYNSEDYAEDGLTKIIEDLGIDPKVLNFSNPLWLMSPDGKGSDEYLDPTLMIEYLIENGVDPLMLLSKVNTTKRTFYDDDAYYPLRGSFFGTDDPSINDNDIYTESNDFPKLAFDYSTKFYIPAALTVGDTWIESYPEIGDDVQYEIVKQEAPISAWKWNDYGELTDSTFRGIICENLDGNDVLNWRDDDLPVKNDIIWRIYSNDPSDFWGYAYDHETQLRNNYMVSTKPIVFAQNITLDPSKITSYADIEEASLSISYRYPSGSQTTSFGRIGIAVWNSDLYVNGGFEYIVDDEASTNVYINPTDSMNGYLLYNEDNEYKDARNFEQFKQWERESVDVTFAIKEAYQNYIDHDFDPQYLQLEIAFGSKSNGVIYYDDVVLEIDYTNEIDTPFQLKQLFQYIEDNQDQVIGIDGNPYDFLNQIDFDPVDMISMFEEDNGIQRDGEDGANMTNFLSSTGTSINRLIKLMQDQTYYDRLENGKYLSFLEMLNYSRYIIDGNEETTVDTPYGPRTILNDEGWVIEDPYYASKVLTQSLYEEMYTNDFNTYKGYSQEVIGKELWTMFENLDVMLPWISVYLLMHGWSKDDIFDVFEALGLFRETKHNYVNSLVASSHGQIRMSLNISESVHFTSVGITTPIFDDHPMNFTTTMIEPIDDNFMKLYQFLDRQGDVSLIHTIGPINPAQEVDLGGDFSFDVLFGTITIRGYTDTTLNLKDYELWVWTEGNTGSSVAQWGDVNNPYVTSYGYRGLTDEGASLLTNYLRQTIDFNDAPFLEMTGDAIGLFQFLDNYVYTTSRITDPLDNGKTIDYDYSSYQLLNYFDVSAKDFIDIITGYDQVSGTFDPDNDGRADDWTPPSGEYGGWVPGSTVAPSDLGLPLRGWGLNVSAHRLFWNSVNRTKNGHIIWSDSPRFLSPDFTGVVTNDTYIDQGAPPIVNLIDMLLWLSLTIGTPDPETLFNWLEGRLSVYEYIVPNFDLVDDAMDVWSYNHGMGQEKLWNTIEEMQFNFTGALDWLQNVKGSDPYEYLYALNNWDDNSGSDSPDPQGLFYYVQNPDFVLYPDGGVGYINHNGMGGTSESLSKSNFWKLFNGSWWDENVGMDYWNYDGPWYETLPGQIFQQLHIMEMSQIAEGYENYNLTYNIFEMLMDMEVNAADWINALQDAGIKPMELLAVYPTLNMTQLLQNARNLDKKTMIKINGTFRLNIYGLSLWDPRHSNNSISYSIDPTDYSVEDYLMNFFDPSIYSSSSGTYSIYS